jgi:O-antigen/teichoic acid export membrane protein
MNSRATRTIRDAGKLFGAQLIASVFAVFFSSWLARHLPSVELSLLPIAAGMAGAVEVTAGLGLRETFVRLVPDLITQQRQPEAATMLRTGLLLNTLLTGLLCAVIYVFAAPVAHLFLKGEAGDAGPGIVRLLTLAVGFTALSKLLEAALRAVQEFGKIAFLRLMSTVSRACLAVLFYMAMGVTGAVIAISLVPFFAVVLSIIWLWPYVRGAAGPWRARSLIKQSFSFYLASLANAGTQRFDFLLLGAITNPETLAAYYVARQLADYLALLNASLMDALAPKVGELKSCSREELGRAFSRCTRYLFLGLLPVHVALALVGHPVVAIFAGGKYPQAGLIVSVLCVALFAEVLSELHRRFIVVVGQQWYLIITDTTSGLLSPFVTAGLMMTMGGVGVAAAKAVVFGVQWIVGKSLLGRAIRLRYDLRALAVAASGCLLAAGAYFAGAHLIGGHMGLIVGCGLGLVLYGVLVFGRLTPDDRRLLAGIHHR